MRTVAVTERDVMTKRHLMKILWSIKIASYTTTPMLLPSAIDPTRGLRLPLEGSHWCPLEALGEAKWWRQRRERGQLVVMG